MVKQYPDHIEVRIAGEPCQDENLNWVKPEPVLFKSDCRAEPAGKNAIIRRADGSDASYDFNVFMPKTSVNIPEGAFFHLVREDGSEAKGYVKRAHNGQLNSRLWV